MSIRSVLGALVVPFLVTTVGCAANATADEDLEPVGTSEDALSLAAPLPKAPAPKAIDLKGGATAVGGALTEGVSDARRAALAAINGVAQSDGKTTFVLGLRTATPIVFQAFNEHVAPLADGFRVSGDLTIDTPAGPLNLASADLVFQWAQDRADGFETLRGSVELAFPSVGGLDFSGDSLVRATVGYDRGANLKDIEAPVNPDRHYLVFDLAYGLSASSGPITISAPGGKSGRLLLDPSDPSFYVGGSLFGLGGLGPLEDMGIGMSARGLIPFTPVSTWGIEGKVKPLTGHLYAKGSVQLVKYPIRVDGEIVANLDPEGSGRPLWNSTATGMELGANGTLNIATNFLDFFSFEVPVSHATLGIRATRNEQYAYYSGTTGADTSWLPIVLPLVPAGESRLAGLFHSDLSRSFLKAEGEYLLKTTLMAEMMQQDFGITLKEISLAKANLDVNKDGFRVVGVAKTPFHDSFAVRGDLRAEAFMGEKPSEWFADMRGEASVYGLPLAGAHGRLDRRGLSVDGTFRTPLSNVVLAGGITKTGANMSGAVSFSVRGTREVVQVVTDAAVCGSTRVADGAKCGYSTVRDGAICGTRIVESAALCGTRTVTDAGRCGTRMVTDGAVCGWNTLKSAAQCIASGFKNCKSPKTCAVVKICQIANSCSIANECRVPNACDIPNTCPKTVTIPDFDFGTFQGTMSVAANSGGVSGAVDGRICQGSTCTALPSGRVILGNDPRACLRNVPGAASEVCTRF